MRFLVATVEVVETLVQVAVLRDIRNPTRATEPSTHLRYPDPAQHGVVSQGDLDQH